MELAILGLLVLAPSVWVLLRAEQPRRVPVPIRVRRPAPRRR